MYYGICIYTWGFPGGSGVKNPSTNAENTAFIPGPGRFPWRRKWQPTSVFLPKKFHGQSSLEGYSLWGDKESDTTDQLSTCTHVHYGIPYLTICVHVYIYIYI